MKNQSKKRDKKTRKNKKRGGKKTRKISTDLAKNSTELVLVETKLSENYYEIVITAKKRKYLVRYIVPDHFLFKTPDQVFKNPEFKAVLLGEKTPRCLFAIDDSKSPNNGAVYYITIFVKVLVNKEYRWFAMIDSGSQVQKTGNQFDYVFYSINKKNCQLSNENETNVIVMNNMFKKSYNGDVCTVILKSEEGGGAVQVVDKKSIYQSILVNLFTQLQTDELLKDQGVIAATDYGIDELFEALNDN